MSLTRDSVAALLAASDLSALELRGPGIHLHLRNDAGTVTDIATATPITAPAIGHVLWQHPLHSAPLAPTGTRVRVGQIVALLRIGPLLRPVLAPADGVLGAQRIAAGSLAGYGTALIDLHEDTP